MPLWRLLQLVFKRFEPNFPLNRIDKRTDVVNFSSELALGGRRAAGGAGLWRATAGCFRSVRF